VCVGESESSSMNYIEVRQLIQRERQKEKGKKKREREREKERKKRNRVVINPHLSFSRGE
jgi:hypothetical protein